MCFEQVKRKNPKGVVLQVHWLKDEKIIFPCTIISRLGENFLGARGINSQNIKMDTSSKTREEHILKHSELSY